MLKPEAGKHQPIRAGKYPSFEQAITQIETPVCNRRGGVTELLQIIYRHGFKAPWGGTEYGGDALVIRRI